MTKCKAILVALTVLTLNAFCEDLMAYADITSPRITISKYCYAAKRPTNGERVAGRNRSQQMLFRSASAAMRATR